MTVSAHKKLHAEQLIARLKAAEDACFEGVGAVPLFIWSAASSHFSNLRNELVRALSVENERLDHHMKMAEINLGHFEEHKAAA